jgi:hypothetical protein
MEEAFGRGRFRWEEFQMQVRCAVAPASGSLTAILRGRT